MTDLLIANHDNSDYLGSREVARFEISRDGIEVTGTLNIADGDGFWIEETLQR